MLEIVKPQLDVGLLSGRPAVVDYWRDEAGLAYDHALTVRPGHVQHRFDEGGSVVKVNVVETPLGDQRSGIVEVLVARDGLAAPRALADTDGNRLAFVPTGHAGVTQLGVRIAVRDLARTRAWYRDVLGFDEETPGRMRCGDSVLLFEERADAPSGFARAERGWTYLTVQIRDCDAETARIVALADDAVVAVPPTTLGEVARMAMVRDPDGNWLELSQRASLTGPLPKS